MNVLKAMKLWSVEFAWILMQMKLSSAMETEVSVDCQTDPNHMSVDVKTDVPFTGKIYIGNRFNDTQCIVRGEGKTTTTIKIPYRACNTTQKREGLFMNQITVQQRRMIVSAGDGEYQVGCQMFTGDIRLETNNSMAVTLPSAKLTTEKMSPPLVLLRVYDFENDVFLDTVRLGQVVELEVTITDGKNYKGRVSNCDAYSGDGNRVAVVRQYCPVDLTLSDKVYVDDQSGTTGDYYLYIPFRVFRFLDGKKVSFSCNVIICQDDCPEADCGNFTGMSYGRRRRDVTGTHPTMTVTNQVTVLDDSNTHFRKKEAAGQQLSVGDKTPEEEEAVERNPKTPLLLLIGGVTVALLVSLCLNLVLYRRTRRKNDPKGGQEVIVYDNVSVLSSYLSPGTHFSRMDPSDD